MKQRSIEAHHGAQSRVQRCRKSIGILADNQMALLEAENSLSLDAERPQTLVTAGFQDRFPQVPGKMAGAMDFVSQLSHKADSQQSAADAGYVRFSNRHIRECVGQEILSC